jgi:hypothetical protein
VETLSPFGGFFYIVIQAAALLNTVICATSPKDVLIRAVIGVTWQMLWQFSIPIGYHMQRSFRPAPTTLINHGGSDVLPAAILAATPSEIRDFQCHMSASHHPQVQGYPERDGQSCMWLP